MVDVVITAIGNNIHAGVCMYIILSRIVFNIPDVPLRANGVYLY